MVHLSDTTIGLKGNSHSLWKTVSTESCGVEAAPQTELARSFLQFIYRSIVIYYGDHSFPSLPPQSL